MLSLMIASIEQIQAILASEERRLLENLNALDLTDPAADALRLWGLLHRARFLARMRDDLPSAPAA